jgi:hypothetical protein
MQIRLLPAEQTLKFGDARLGFLELVSGLGGGRAGVRRGRRIGRLQARPIPHRPSSPLAVQPRNPQPAVESPPVVKQLAIDPCLIGHRRYPLARHKTLHNLLLQRVRINPSPFDSHGSSSRKPCPSIYLSQFQGALHE